MPQKLEADMKGLTLREILTATGGVPLGGFRDFDMEANIINFMGKMWYTATR